MKKTDFFSVIASMVAERRRSKTRNPYTKREQSALAFFSGKESALFQHGKNPLSVITIALMLFAAWGCFSCNNNLNPATVETATSCRRIRFSYLPAMLY